MRVGVIQSSYIPWRGYFDFIRSVDLFIFHDDIQYTKGDWRNRNRIKTSNGVEWVTVPVQYKKVSQLICDTAIDYSTPWMEKHLRRFEASYKGSPYVSDALSILHCLRERPYETISQLNIHLIAQICKYFGITTPTCVSSELGVKGEKTDRLMNLMKKVGGDIYLSGPSADCYLDKQSFVNAGISLEYKTYDYQPYSQLWGEFQGNVTVLDLIANCGPDSSKYLCSEKPSQIIVDVRK